MSHERQPNLNDQWQQLREETVTRTESELTSRIHTNPHPTELETRIGAFIEELEPQVRNAVETMAKKGYTTASSGFYGPHGEIQQIDGPFTIDPEIRAALSELGVYVKTGEELGFPRLGAEYSGIGFYPATPDLPAITEMWDRVVAMLPQKDATTVASISGGAEDFRRQYAPERTDIELLALKRNIAEGPEQWDEQTWAALNARYTELSNLL